VSLSAKIIHSIEPEGFADEAGRETRAVAERAVIRAHTVLRAVVARPPGDQAGRCGNGVWEEDREFARDGVGDVRGRFRQENGQLARNRLAAKEVLHGGQKDAQFPADGLDDVGRRFWREQEADLPADGVNDIGLLFGQEKADLAADSFRDIRLEFGNEDGDFPRDGLEWLGGAQ
jgi:hypothetical protein